MSFGLRNYTILLTTCLAACPDTPAATETGSSEGSSSSTDPTSGGVTPTGTDATSAGTTTTGEGSTSTGATDGTTGPGAVCAGFLCGALLACCEAAEVCVDNACVGGCASGVRCGEDLELCCEVGEVCSETVCSAPGDACATSADCGPGTFCDPAAGACLPLPEPLACESTGDAIAVALEWSFTDDEVIALPVVVDVTGDGVPEVIVNTTRQTGDEIDFPIGELICLDGATGELVWRIVNNPQQDQFGALGRATIAAGDVSGDGLPDIVYAGRYADPITKVSPIHAVDGEGALLWTARNPDDSEARIAIENAAAAVANLDDDPMAEIAFGAAILDDDGLLVWNQNGEGALVGSPHNKNQPSQYLYKGGISTFADLTGDGYPELITGREAWSIDWVAGDPPIVTLTMLWQDTSGFAGDGWPSIADLDGNGTPEVVLVAWPEIKILDGATGALWCGVDPTGVMCMNNDALRTAPIDIPGANLGGPATIADFDGDGRPEFGLTTGSEYRVFDLNRAGEEVVVAAGEPQPAAGAIYSRWRVPVQDNSSAATGSIGFDHDADGATDVFYQDECSLRAFSGATGDVLFELANSTATIHEYPVVADVDGDGATELLVVANLSNANANVLCVDDRPGWTPRQGVYLYRAAADDWAATRAVWPQHTYHVTDADDAGNPPLSEQANWLVPDRNDFRVAPHGAAPVTAAPDLTVSLAVDQAQCPASLVLQAHIVNQGALGVPAGVPVVFHAGADATGEVVAMAATAVALVPGGFTIVEAVVAAPGDVASFHVDVDPDGAVAECLEANNGALVFEAGCP